MPWTSDPLVSTYQSAAGVTDMHLTCLWAVLRTEPRASCMLGQATSELTKAPAQLLSASSKSPQDRMFQLTVLVVNICWGKKGAKAKVSFTVVCKVKQRTGWGNNSSQWDLEAFPQLILGHRTGSPHSTQTHTPNCTTLNMDRVLT